MTPPSPTETTETTVAECIEWLEREVGPTPAKDGRDIAFYLATLAYLRRPVADAKSLEAGAVALEADNGRDMTEDLAHAANLRLCAVAAPAAIAPPKEGAVSDERLSRIASGHHDAGDLDAEAREMARELLQRRALANKAQP